jgi:Ca-activated chloride channel family protein
MDGRIIRYEIEDRYVNSSGRVAEVDYILPLPKGAAFEQLELSINGQMIAGETMRSDQARSVYEEIVRKLRDPALVEWMGHDLLRTRIFPIQPGEEKRVVVHFSAVAQREGDALRLDWPARAVANARNDDDWFELQYNLSGAGESLGEAYSPTHNVSVTDRSRAARTVRMTDATRAMTLLVPVRHDGAATVSFLPYAPSGEDGYALITLSPPARKAHDSARDLTFVVDVSGSMSGQKIEQARAAGRQFLNSLSPGDRFRIISFSTDVRDFRDGWTPVNGETIRSASNFVDDLRAGGGTNLAGALEAALAESPSRGRLAFVLMITDGAPTVGETRPDVIAARAATLRGGARVFTFGLGADVNAALLEQLALQGRGAATFLRPSESVERGVGVVAERLTSPVASDVTIKLDGSRLYAIQPQGAVDLFAGQDLVVLARYSGSCDGATLVIEGRGPDGPVRWIQRVHLPDRATQNSFVARLWAVQRAGWLSAERRRTGGNAEIDGELRELGERHGIPTELTSYLVVEPGMNAHVGAVQGAAAAAPVSEVRRFEAAKLSSDQRDLKTLGGEKKDALDESGRLMKVAGSRTFRVDKEGTWTDTKKQTALRTIKVRAYSDAYFTLIREIPELAQWFAVGEKVRVEGRTVTIELSPTDGVTALDATALIALKRDWQ